MADKKRINVRAAGAPEGSEVDIEPGDTAMALLQALGQDTEGTSIRRAVTGEPLHPLDDLFAILSSGESVTYAPLMDAGS